MKMEKLIDSNAYYVESRKAINIALAKMRASGKN